MKFHCVLPSLVCVALLSACASSSTSPTAEAPVARTTSVKAAMAEANAAALSGRPDKAYALLKQASITYPNDKAPWVRMAQMRFDSNNYGDAIGNALEALRRDPDDTLANSVVAVSGLRLSSKALSDLTRKNNLSGSVRTEAQDLAKLLRTSLGEDTLFQREQRTTPPKASTRSKSTTTASAAATTSTSASSRDSSSGSNSSKSSGDPFGALK
jgi:tetratricopeptide (TPR) repeat protein